MVIKNRKEVSLETNQGGEYPRLLRQDHTRLLRQDHIQSSFYIISERDTIIIKGNYKISKRKKMTKKEIWEKLRLPHRG
jgi:hypothetical protein